MEDSYTKTESDKRLADVHTAISAEVQSVQSAISVKIAGLATKEDVQSIVESNREIERFVKNVDTGVYFIRISGRLLAQIGSFIAALVAIYVAIKFFFGGIIHHFF